MTKMWFFDKLKIKLNKVTVIIVSYFDKMKNGITMIFENTKHCSHKVSLLKT